MVVACIADLNFAPTKAAANALLRENRNPGTIYVTGNSVIDALLATRARIEAQPSLAAGLDDLADRFAGKRIITVTSHRRENFGGGMENIAAAVSESAARPEVAVIFPVHPNPDVGRVMDGDLGERVERRGVVKRGVGTGRIEG